VSVLSSGTVIAGGGAHSLAIKTDGTVWAWGKNGYGQLGDGTIIDRHAPVQVSGLTGVFIAIAGGGFLVDDGHSLALRNDGTVWAWGENVWGQLGDGTTTERHTPVQVVGAGGIGFLTGISAIARGIVHSVALKNDSTVWEWGMQIGDASPSYTPVQVPGLASITAISGGYEHAMALKNDGTVWAWGFNANGQLGDGTTSNRSTPVQVVGTGGVNFLTGISAIAAGDFHSLALKNDGTVWVWGDGRTTPAQVSGLADITAIAACDEYSIALKNDGTVWALTAQVPLP
jgi:alpha-tubulin suppressor-like RCC1 family protein